MTIKLEVGKRYVRRDGAVVTLIREDSSDQPYLIGDLWYYRDGICNLLGAEYDIVSEYVEPSPAVNPIAVPPVSALPIDSAARKEVPIASGVVDYFPAALVEIAKLSHAGNAKHNPGQPLHWSRGKSNDHADTIMRHFVERGTVDAEDGIRHSVKLAWRALALLQLELEAAGAPKARGAV